MSPTASSFVLKPPSLRTLNNYSSACEFRALDLAVLFNHSLVAETLLTVGASASYVAVDNRSTEFPVLPGLELAFDRPKSPFDEGKPVGKPSILMFFRG